MSRIVVDQKGTISFIYSDELRYLLDEGISTIKRVSHVEPAETGRGWTADMGPVNGPMLGPFETRQEALDREVEYLNTHVL